MRVAERARPPRPDRRCELRAARSRCAGSRGSAGPAVPSPSPSMRSDALAHARRVGPLVLLLVQLLQVDQRVAVARIEPHALPGTPRARDRRSRRGGSRGRGRAARRRARACVRSGRCSSAWWTLMARPTWPFCAIQVAEDHLDLERVAGRCSSPASARRWPDRPGCRRGSSARACSAAFRAAGGGRSSGRRAACSAPTPCRHQAREQGDEDGEEHVRSHPAARRAQRATILPPVEGLREVGHSTGQNISMRQRSCRCTTPSTCCAASTTTTAVICRCSRMCSASAASVSGAIVIGLRGHDLAGGALEQMRGARPCAGAGRRR